MEIKKPEKAWSLKIGKAKKTIKLGSYFCSKCRKKFRAGYK